MERELMDLFEATKKAADAAAGDGVPSNGPEVGRCVDALKQLKGFPISYDILVSTQVGKRLRPLTKHPKEKIHSVASNLLEMWKKIVIDETTRKKNGVVNDKNSAKAEVSNEETVKVGKFQKSSSAKLEQNSNSESVKVGKLQKSSSAKLEKHSNSESVKVEKISHAENVKVEKISSDDRQASSFSKTSQASVAPPKLTAVVKCNDSLRDKIRELLAEALSKVASEAEEDIRTEVNACDPMRVAVSVESAMFEKLGRSNGTQKFKYRSIMFNMKDGNNPDLRRKVLLGQIRPEKLITMTAEEMASEQRQRENNQIKEKALFDCQLGGPAKATTDQFKCGRCGQRKCTYYQMQTRSADEPMTTYVTCVNCNNHWKFC